MPQTNNTGPPMCVCCYSQRKEQALLCNIQHHHIHTHTRACLFENSSGNNAFTNRRPRARGTPKVLHKINVSSCKCVHGNVGHACFATCKPTQASAQHHVCPVLHRSKTFTCPPGSVRSQPDENAHTLHKSGGCRVNSHKNAQNPATAAHWVIHCVLHDSRTISCPPGSNRTETPENAHPPLH